MNLEVGLSFFNEVAALALLAWFVWWRLDRVEKRLEELEDELRKLLQQLARLEGRLNGRPR